MLFWSIYLKGVFFLKKPRSQWCLLNCLINILGDDTQLIHNIWNSGYIWLIFRDTGFQALTECLCVCGRKGEGRKRK